MSFELWNTVATVGTFLVIAATALAAIVQLRQVRGSNQITVLTELRASQDNPEHLKAVHYVYGKLGSNMQDPEFRYQLANRNARTIENNQKISYAETVGDFYEEYGGICKDRIDRPKSPDGHPLNRHYCYVECACRGDGDFVTALRAVGLRKFRIPGGAV